MSCKKHRWRRIVGLARRKPWFSIISVSESCMLTCISMLTHISVSSAEKLPRCSAFTKSFAIAWPFVINIQVSQRIRLEQSCNWFCFGHLRQKHRLHPTVFPRYLYFYRKSQLGGSCIMTTICSRSTRRSSACLPWNTNNCILLQTHHATCTSLRKHAWFPRSYHEFSKNVCTQRDTDCICVTHTMCVEDRCILEHTIRMTELHAYFKITSKEGAFSHLQLASGEPTLLLSCASRGPHCSISGTRSESVVYSDFSLLVFISSFVCVWVFVVVLSLMAHVVE